MSKLNRLAADAAHAFGGIELDRGTPLSFRLDGRRIEGFAGDSVLSAVLASGIDTYGKLGDFPLGLGERFAPLIALDGGQPLPMARTPAVDSADFTTVGRKSGLAFRQPASLRHVLTDAPPPAWSGEPGTKLSADLVVVGGGVAGLAAAGAALAAGRSVIVVERRPWLGGDARYFGQVGDAASPETTSAQLVADAAAATTLTRAEAFGIRGTTVLVHQVVAEGRALRTRIVAITGRRVVLATGALQRLPIFAGNRLPGVIPAIEAYHLAKRYGVVHGPTALVSTQGNYGYRLALRLHDAGIGVRRVVDTRVGVQSRFVDFAKASGLSLGSGQVPIAASASKGQLSVGFANEGMARAAAVLEATQLVVAGTLQPDLALWMLAGGGVVWSDGRLLARGQVPGVALAGSVAGYVSLEACTASGRDTQSRLFGGIATDIADPQIDPMFETPDASTPIAPRIDGPAFLDGGSSPLLRPSLQGARSVAAGHALSLGHVAAAADLGIIAPGDAGALAEERGAPGADIVASGWQPDPGPATAQPFLAGRLGPDPVRVRLFVDNRRVFAPGALVYAGADVPDPTRAIGVIIEDARPGGVALMSRRGLRRTDRFVVATLEGPSPARIRQS